MPSKKPLKNNHIVTRELSLSNPTLRLAEKWSLTWSRCSRFMTNSLLCCGGGSLELS